MAKNTGKDYEILVQGIFQMLVDQQSVPNVTVKRNVTLQGLTGNTHQIDVYWEFRLADVVYKTVVQCKNWSSRVKQEQVLAFNSVLQDIPGQPRGIMVTSTGVQSGAERFAKSHGIVVYHLRSPDDAFWKGKLRRIVVNLHFAHPSITDVRPIIDEDWAKKVKQERGIDRFTVKIEGYPKDLQLVDSHGAPIGTVDDVLDGLVPAHYDEAPPEQKQIQFASDTFLIVQGGDVDRLKIKGLLATVAQTTSTDTKVALDGADFVKYVLTDLTNGGERIIRPEDVK